MRLSLFLFLFLTVVNSSAVTLVVSDIDDTIRLTHRHANLLEQLDNASDPTLAFKGIPEIYRSLNDNQAVITYVSGTVDPIAGFAEDLLKTNHFPQADHFYYKGWFDDTKEFKISAIEALIDSVRPDKIILIGDNGEQDPEAYAEIDKKYVNVDVYIHKLYDIEVPKEQSIYFTGADLALLLQLQGDLTIPQAQAAVTVVSQAIKSGDAKALNLIVPEWSELEYKEVAGSFALKSKYPGMEAELSALETFIYNTFELDVSATALLSSSNGSVTLKVQPLPGP